jgi:GNAT superfamily N-acetyltransferase
VEQLQFAKNYQANQTLRISFNDLAKTTLGINFEPWYEKGFWTNRYEPYSFIDGVKVVANVSVNKLDLIINGELKKAIQIGTVMTHSHYQNRGLSKRLMNKVLGDYEEQVDVIYLFANHSVLDYYPKFGFKAVDEHLFSMKFSGSINASSHIEKLNPTCSRDLAFIYEFAKKRQPISQYLSTSNTAELVMFYSMYVFPENIVYLKDENVIIIYKQEGDTLHLYDVISQIPFQIDSVLAGIADEKTMKVVFYFTPELTLDVEYEKYDDSGAMFVKLNEDVKLPKKFKHPMISQA